MTSMREDELLGEKVAELFSLRLEAGSTHESKRFKTSEGTKTALGIGRTIRRLIQEAKTEKFTSATYVEG